MVQGRRVRAIFGNHGRLGESCEFQPTTSNKIKKKDRPTWSMCVPICKFVFEYQLEDWVCT